MNKRGEEIGQGITSMVIIILVVLLMFVFVILSASYFKLGETPDNPGVENIDFRLVESRVLGEIFLDDKISYDLDELGKVGVETDLLKQDNGERMRDYVRFTFIVERESSKYTLKNEPYLRPEQARALFLPIEESFAKDYGCDMRNELKIGYLEGENFKVLVDYPDEPISEGFAGRNYHQRDLPESFLEKGSEEGNYMDEISSGGNFIVFRGGYPC